MKLVMVCLFAVCCWPFATSSRNNSDKALQLRKLKEVQRQLNVVKESLQLSEMRLNTPPKNIEDCCCLSALYCFRANLNVQFNTDERHQKQLYKSLKNKYTERGLDFCNSRNSTCNDCASHPKENAREFFNRLESLIQRAVDRMSMN